LSTAYDVAIAGGGLGSAALAKNMAEQGAKGSRLEHEHQFKDRVRGEVMFPGATLRRGRSELLIVSLKPEGTPSTGSTLTLRVTW